MSFSNMFNLQYTYVWRGYQSVVGDFYISYSKLVIKGCDFLGAAYFRFMAVNIIKLIVGCQDLEEYAQWQARQEIDYEGGENGRAVPCLTRFKAKRADEVLASGGSLYRVLKSRVICRQKIVGFEMVETGHKGTMCAIMLEPEIVTVVNAPHRPFQGWRYFDDEKAPADRGVYVIGQGDEDEEPPEEMADELRDAGLL